MNVVLKWVKTLVAIALFLAVCLYTYPAFAQTASDGTLTVNWTAPTQYTEGTAILPADLVKYQVWVDTIAVPVTPVKVPIEVLADKVTVDVPLVMPQGGTVFVRVSACTIQRSDSAVKCSPASNMVSKAIPALPPPQKTPNAPTSITLQIRITPAP